MNQVLLYVTAGTAEEAIHIGRVLVETRLTACANVIPGMTSIYRWQYRINEEPEVVLILKTRSDLIDEAVTQIKTLHSYTCPCVVSIPLYGGNVDFLQWITEETS
jgi:periplasmic divalent cation tolerance protein